MDLDAEPTEPKESKKSRFRYYYNSGIGKKVLWTIFIISLIVIAAFSSLFIFIKPVADINNPVNINDEYFSMDLLQYRWNYIISRLTEN